MRNGKSFEEEEEEEEKDEINGQSFLNGKVYVVVRCLIKRVSVCFCSVQFSLLRKHTGRVCPTDGSKSCVLFACFT